MVSLLSQLLPDMNFRGALVLLDAQSRLTKSGTTYLDLKFRDRSGEISGKRWQVSEEEVDALKGVTFVYVVGRVESFQGRNQLRVETVTAYEPTAEELQGLVRASHWESDLLWRELRTHLRHEISDDSLWSVVEAALEDPEVMERARWIAAANTNHHAYRSGLAEHMLSMMRLSAQVIRHYERYYPIPIHRGLVAAGIFFHDLGKIWELEGSVQTTYTTEGRLLGHIFMAASWLGTLGERVDAPRELIVELQHIVLSHHGQLEFGSPKRPKTVEAMVVHHIDKLDADMNHWMHELGQTEGWTTYQRNYERFLFRADQTRGSWTQGLREALGERGPGTPVDEVQKTFQRIDAPPRQASEKDTKLTTPSVEGESVQDQEASQSGHFDEEVPPFDPEGGAPDALPTEDETLSLFDGLAPYRAR